MKPSRIFFCGLVVSLCLPACTFASAQSLRASPSIGAVVQGSHYDPVRGSTIVRIVNNSNKIITALHIPFSVTLPDGTESTPGANALGVEFLPYIVWVSLAGHPFEGQGNGGIEPGAFYDHEFLGQPGPVKATVDLVAYADGTADVVNEDAFSRLIEDRKARVRAMLKADELLADALADPTVERPSMTVAAQLKVLAAAINQQKSSDKSAAAYASELQDASQNIGNRWQAPTGRSEREDRQLRALIKTHEDQISLMLPHTELKEVRP
jgi:hypothetical protein